MVYTNKPLFQKAISQFDSNKLLLKHKMKVELPFLGYRPEIPVQVSLRDATGFKVFVSYLDRCKLSESS